MDNISNEPLPDTPLAGTDAVDQPLTPEEQRREQIQYHVDALQELSDTATRVHGWTPYARRLFLETLADCGKVATACSYVGMTRQSAYALRVRDPLFAAGWDAACELARAPLADALYERAIDGFEEVITRDDGRTVTRHRFDSRLSIAVLNRLDRHCERAAEQASRHLGAMDRWDEFVAAIGAGKAAEAEAMLEAAQAARLEERKNAIHCQNCQLPDSDEEEEDEQPYVHRRVWQKWDTEEWRTDFPPPPGFDGDEKGSWEESGYSRSLTGDELAALTAGGLAEPPPEVITIEEDVAERDAFFSSLVTPAPDGQTDTVPQTVSHAGHGPACLKDKDEKADPGSSPG